NVAGRSRRSRHLPLYEAGRDAWVDVLAYVILEVVHRVRVDVRKRRQVRRHRFFAMDEPSQGVVAEGERAAELAGPVGRQELTPVAVGVEARRVARLAKLQVAPQRIVVPRPGDWVCRRLRLLIAREVDQVAQMVLYERRVLETCRAAPGGALENPA